MFAMFFFFQAEDGIRVGRVTGVQTCALPISPSVSAFPVDVELISAPSVSKVLERVYAAENCKPQLKRFVRLASSPLYQELPSASINRRESGGIPRMGTRW